MPAVEAVECSHHQGISTLRHFAGPALETRIPKRQSLQRTAFQDSNHSSEVPSIRPSDDKGVYEDSSAYRTGSFRVVGRRATDIPAGTAQEVSQSTATLLPKQ